MLKAPATKPGQKKIKEKVTEINAVNFSIIDGLGRGDKGVNTRSGN